MAQEEGAGYQRSPPPNTGHVISAVSARRANHTDPPAALPSSERLEAYAERSSRFPWRNEEFHGNDCAGFGTSVKVRQFAYTMLHIR